MKNIFKIMGVALLASSMILVSCKKDETKPDTDNDTNVVTYKLTLKVNDGAMGSVAANPQKSAYKAGDTVVLTATANPGFKFANWDDANTDNPRTIVITSDKSYTANFAAAVPDHMTVTFNETTWTPTTWIAGMYQTRFIMQLHKQYQAADQPLIQITSGTTVGTFEAASGNHYGWLYYNVPGESAEYEGNTYAKWQCESFLQTITEIDMNTTYMVFTAEGEVYDLGAYANGDDVIYPVSVDVAGTWTAANWSKGGLLK